MSFYDLNAKDISGNIILFSDFKNKVILIVNTASACGFTPQYEELEEIHQAYGDKLEILAFPCNQFGKQESGSNEEIQSFCNLKFNIGFKLFSKIDVNGGETHEVFKFLKSKAPGILGSKQIKWNFTKFLISKDGKSIQRYAPKIKPNRMIKDIEALLSL